MKVRTMFGAALVSVLGGTAGSLGMSSAPASAGALVVQCESVFPYLKGVIIFGRGKGSAFSGNCHQHVYAPGPPTAVDGSGYTVSCDEGLPDFAPEYTYGVQIYTPSGNVLTNCVVHNWPGSKP